MLWASHQSGLELRKEGGEIRLSGRFPYGVETVLREAEDGNPELREVFAPRAFATITEHRNRNVFLLSGHDMSKPIASFSRETLELTETDEALLIEARISPVLQNVTWVKDIVATVQSGLTVGISPGFRVAPDLQNAEVIERHGNMVRRTINAALLEEISIVTRPAYPAAQIEARNWGKPKTPYRNPRLPCFENHPSHYSPPSRWR